jgi:2-dehydro-3-deoxygluconokinase
MCPHKWQVPVSYSTALPDNVISHDLIKWLEAKASSIKLQGDRMTCIAQLAKTSKRVALFMIEPDLHCAIAQNTINWDEIFHGKTCHFVSPALNEDTAALCVEALRKASEAKYL